MIKQLINDKVILLNTGAITVSFMDIEAMLKILLLSVSIIYTLIRLYKEYTDINDEK
jgi:hypothetical protein